MDRRNTKKFSFVDFFKTYPRLLTLIITIILCVVFFTIGFFVGKPGKTAAELAYDEQVWMTKASKEKVAQEELENKFITERANAEQTAQKIRYQIADTYAQTQAKIANADANAISTKAKAEAEANKEIAGTLSSDLMEYLRWKDNNGGNGNEKKPEAEKQDADDNSI